jgi:unspecific monooxygenase
MLELEPPDHTRLRKLVQKAFVARNIEHMRMGVEAYCATLLGKMEQGRGEPFDFLDAYATPIPIWVITSLLGVPQEMGKQMLEWSHAMVRMYQIGRTAEQEKLAVEAAIAFSQFIRDYIEIRRKDPRDDLLSALIVAQEAGDALTEDELVSTCILLLNAGHEATVHVLGNGLYALLQYPQQLDWLRKHPQHIATAVEELLRYDTPLHMFTRYALDDVSYRGMTLQFGEQVGLLLGAANRDPAVFTEADNLDLTRQPNPHVSFGGGIHYCLGAPLARLELQIAVPMLLERFPTITLAASPVYRNAYHFHSLENLMITI